jgi:hypothetical protein
MSAYRPSEWRRMLTEPTPPLQRLRQPRPDLLFGSPARRSLASCYVRGNPTAPAVAVVATLVKADDLVWNPGESR